MNDESDKKTDAETLVKAPGNGVCEVKLPTLQRNALCKIFDRPEFTPEEVHALGHKRLQRSEGLGHKGLLIVAEWLRFHGLELSLPAPPAYPTDRIDDTVQNEIKGAVRLLRTYGYRVRRIQDKIPK
ncbi:MAG: hypothetical protein CVU16_10805 [Betaproteobacteria bacterium HGW-Betaproteobacteria-10]|nr:MAG: hypothetical protein CVU16_10805 [Betaproteobacteria bacterium HGW-Betaproteobacteria-10]